MNKFSHSFAPISNESMIKGQLFFSRKNKITGGGHSRVGFCYKADSL